tara:strand:- start:293 stop:1189 length:897 start_codon:yes stop_codon:yes gene_type:complete
MKSLTDYKKFFSSIEDPLERLDGIEVLLEDLENPLTEIQGNYDMGRISSEEYETESQKIDSCFRWGNDEISSIKDLHSDLIEERSKNSWSGHNRLKFPVVWDRDSYNKIEPEIRTAGRKGEWIEWLLGNLTEGKDEYWTYEDRILNAAQLDMYYYLDFLDDSFSVSYSCSKISNNFVTFLFNAQKVFELKKEDNTVGRRRKYPSLEKEPTELDKIIKRTMQNRIKSNKDLNWHNVLRDLKNNTNEHQTITIKEIATIHNEMKDGIILNEYDLKEATQKLLISTFQKKLTTFRKLLLRK